eukprot:4848315-Prymnesium_polylepis.2
MAMDMCRIAHGARTWTRHTHSAPEGGTKRAPRGVARPTTTHSTQLPPGPQPWRRQRASHERVAPRDGGRAAQPREEVPLGWPRQLAAARPRRRPEAVDGVVEVVEKPTWHLRGAPSDGGMQVGR